MIHTNDTILYEYEYVYDKTCRFPIRKWQYDWTVHGYIDGFLGTWMKFLENGWRKEGFVFLKGKSCRENLRLPQVLEISSNHIKFFKN